jgi:hypothetical protein
MDIIAVMVSSGSGFRALYQTRRGAERIVPGSGKKLLETAEAARHRTCGKTSATCPGCYPQLLWKNVRSSPMSGSDAGQELPHRISK